jgi:hypothetical protein
MPHANHHPIIIGGGRFDRSGKKIEENFIHCLSMMIGYAIDCVYIAPDSSIH